MTASSPEAPLTRVVLATANPHKAAELHEILAPAVPGIELVPRPSHVPDVPEDEPTLLGNARVKAQALVDATGLPALADDTGLEVDALGGAPGVRSARYAGEPADDARNRAALLAALEASGAHDRSDRTARFRTVVVLRRPGAAGDEVVAEGVVEGRIAPAEAGERGFGYDALFVPTEGDGRTFAQMSADEKHAISHRGRALRALVEALTGR